MTELLGSSTALVVASALAQRVAKSTLPVLLQGENGTGKEVFARQIHEWSGRTGAFVAVNCGAIPDNLVESTLFGHEKGAFTDAKVARSGLFEEANGGTILLDEIGDMPHYLQVKLLRVLETKEITPVGSSKSHAIDVRVLAATNQDLDVMCEAKRFRDDLFWRIAGVTVDLPPLREREEDIKLLAAHFADQGNDSEHDCRIHADAYAVLRGYSWPGNVRELRSVMHLAAILAQDNIVDDRILILPRHLQFNRRKRAVSEISSPFAPVSAPVNTALKTDVVILQGTTPVWAYVSMSVKRDVSVGHVAGGDKDGILTVMLPSQELDLWEAADCVLADPNGQPVIPLTTAEYAAWQEQAQTAQKAVQ